MTLRLKRLPPGLGAQSAPTPKRGKGKAVPARQRDPLDPTEAEIQRNILAYLKAVGVFAWRNMTGGAKVKGGFTRFGKVGSSDILGALKPDGRMLCIEVKRKGGKLSEHQQRFLAEAQAQGALAFVARSVADVQRALAAEGVTP